MGLLSKMLSTLSGNNGMKVSEQLLFDKIIGFKSIVPGCGASIYLQNVAIALTYRTRFNICILDTNFLYPMQYSLLSSSSLKEESLDALDFSGDLSAISHATDYSNLYVIHLQNRSIVDILSGKDTESNINKLIASLKSYFDIILIDLSAELTNTSIFSAIKCNKIIQVADTSFKCLSNIKKSINNTVMLGIPLEKCKHVVLNKDIPGHGIGAKSALESAGLKVIATVPLSVELGLYMSSGKRLYDIAGKEYGIFEFNKAIDAIIDTILEKTPLNSEYIDVKKELKKMEDAQKAKREAETESDVIVDVDYDYDNAADVEVVELPDSEDEETIEEDKSVNVDIDETSVVKEEDSEG